VTTTAISLHRRLVAEALGTGFLLATVVGSGIMAETLAGGNLALALLGNTVATGAILAVLITLFGPLSGAHFNPAVTLVFLLRREIAPPMAALYVVVQVVSGIGGVMVAHVMFGHSLLEAAPHPRSGPGQWTGEFVATFGLVTTILATLRARPEAVAPMVGLFITAGYWFTSSTSFANPAVTVARAFTDSFSGIWAGHAPGFVLAQLAGALAAWRLMSWLLAPADGPSRAISCASTHAAAGLPNAQSVERVEHDRDRHHREAR